MPANIECPECGFMHPPVAKGNCPMARANEVREDAETKHGTDVVNLSIEIQESFLKKIKIYNNPEKHKELGKRVLAFIDTLQ